MAPTLLLTLCVTLVAITQAAHQVSFTGGSRTLPQSERDLTPKIRALQNLLSAMERRDAEKRAADGDCDEACRERRALELLPTARRFLSSLSEKVARGLHERREEGVARAVRGITEALGEASKKRGVSAFGSPLTAVMKEEMERGVIKEGLSSNARRPALREVAEKGLKAAMSLRSMVEKRTMDKRAQDEEMREVSALITDLESQSQKRALEAERLGERAVGDLQDAMKLEKRADHVRHFVLKQQAKRAIGKIAAVNKRALDVKKTEALKRGMKEIKAISEDLQRRELENRESKRNDIFGNLKSLATRVLEEARFVRKSSIPEDLQKKELAGMKIAEDIAQAKRSLDEQRVEKVRELVHMKIAEEVAQAKRSLDERRAQKVRDLAQMKIAEGVATAKRAFEKREFAEQERRVQKVRELATMKIAEGVAKAKRAFEKREFAEKEEKTEELKRIVEGVAKAKRAYEKREFQEKEEQVRKIAEGVETAKRAFVERALEERSLAEKRFAGNIDTLKRMTAEAKSKRALETLQTFKRAVEGQNKHLQAARALEGLKTALEKRELGVRALHEEESVRAVRNIGQALEEALSKRAIEASKREQDLRELEALLADK